MANDADSPRRRRTLTTAERQEIHRLLRSQGAEPSELAERYGVSVRTIRRIWNLPASVALKSTSTAKPFSIRATFEELQMVDDVCRSHGFRSRNHLLRHLIRIAAEVYDPDPKTSNAMADIAQQLRGVAVNINQMARLANQGRLAWSDEERRDLADLARSIGSLSRELTRIRSNAVLSGRSRKVLEGSNV